MSGVDSIGKTVKEFRSTLEVAVAVIGCMVYLNIWWSEQVVSKEEFLIATTEIRIGQVESQIQTYERIGVKSLEAAEKRQYELLIKQEERLNEKRNNLLGL